MSSDQSRSPSRLITALLQQGAVPLSQTPVPSEPTPIKCRIFVDYRMSTVVLEFGKPIQFMGLSVEGAREIGRSFLQAANDLEKAVKNPKKTRKVRRRKLTTGADLQEEKSEEQG